jgi:predicted GNAT superfamily acetyltransferase
VNNSIQVRKLEHIQDQNSARKIFDATWCLDAGTEITPNLLQAMIHTGSYLSGAFIGGKCVGAAFAFPATTGGLHLHSHMTAVLDEYRDQGVGYALKIDQWHWAKKNNYSEISWTQIPADIVAIRTKDREENLRWRRKVREQFLQAFAKDGQVVGFSTNSEYVVRI